MVVVSRAAVAESRSLPVESSCEASRHVTLMGSGQGMESHRARVAAEVVIAFLLELFSLFIVFKILTILKSSNFCIPFVAILSTVLKHSRLKCLEQVEYRYFYYQRDSHY